MPRKHTSPRQARAELLSIKLEKARYEIRALRHAEREREAALALRKATPDWVDMDGQLKQLQLEAEMDAMEACLDARRPKIPILNFDLLPGFIPPPKQKPTVHPDVKIQAGLLKVQEPRNANENHPSPPNGKNWKYPGTLEDRNPAHDYRNYE